MGPTSKKLLVIDDDAHIHDLLDFHLHGVVDEVLHAVLPEQGIRMATESAPDVILLDIEMPQMDGFKVCRRLKDEETTRDIPILFLARDGNSFRIAKGLDSGATDYITKPFAPIELQARVRAAMRMKRLVDLLREHARIDALTGLYNRTSLQEALEEACARFSKRGEPFSLLMLDLDYFKRINDSYGHGVGDTVLQMTGDALRQVTRPRDVCTRYGGEEFAILMHRSGVEEAILVAERILERLRSIEVRAGDEIVRVTGSAGLASCVAETSETRSCDITHVLKIADDALYEAKRLGRDVLATRLISDDEH